MAQGQLEAIAVRSATRAAMSELDRVEVTLEGGVGDDARGRPGDRQVTVLAVESWASACHDVGAELPWTTRRANLLVSGLSLEDTIGARIQLGDVVLAVTGETDPCRVMDLQHPGLRAALEPYWRGGVTCRVVSGGFIEKGAPVSLSENGGNA